MSTIRRRITIGDVAEASGVSRTTVSYVLSGRADVRVPEGTRQRIIEASERLGYQRNALAAGFRSGRMNTLGIVAPFSMLVGSSERQADAYYKGLVLACAAAINDQGFNALLLSEDSDRQVTLSDLTDRRCDGVILVVKSETEEFVCAADTAGLPCVTIGRAVGTWQVHTDNVLGARLAVEHLVGLGHRDLAYLSYTKPMVPSYLQRQRSFLETTSALGVQGRTYVWGEIPALAASVRAGDGPTAVFCYNDELAITLRDACEVEGIQIPSDLSIVGFDDTLLAQTIRPRLTTVHSPLSQLASEAVRLILAQLSGEPPLPQPLYVQPWLVERDSTAAPRQKDSLR
jgi:DNA-binding LacI/PurR family transcriptional regulator